MNISRAALRPHIAILTKLGMLGARPRVGYYYAGKEGSHFWLDYFARIKVGDVKSVPVVVKEQTSVYDAAVTLFLEEANTLFVVNEEGCLRGVVTQKDLLKVSLGATDLTMMPVAVVMVRQGPGLVTMDPDNSILEAATRMYEFDLEALPIVKEIDDKKQKVIGIISQNSLVRLLSDITKSI